MANPAKRGADSYMTQDTQELEEDEEPVGTFQKASGETLAKRK
jgi:hypothetical protein